MSDKQGKGEGRKVPIKTASDADEAVPPEEAPAESAVGDELQTVIAELDAARNQALRAQADLENYRKRVAREREEERRYAALPIVRDLLPGLDNLQRALDAARHTDDLGAMLQGVEMVAQQIDSILTQHGATPIPAVGEPFDPNKHEAIRQMPSAEYPPMTVIDEIERGYTLHDRVVRPSKVIVSVAPPESPPPNSPLSPESED